MKIIKWPNDLDEAKRLINKSIFFELNDETKHWIEKVENVYKSMISDTVFWLRAHKIIRQKNSKNLEKKEYLEYILCYYHITGIVHNQGKQIILFENRDEMHEHLVKHQEEQYQKSLTE